MKNINHKLLIAVFGIDQWFKKRQESQWADREISLKGVGPIRLTLFHNKGAFLGLGKEKPSLVKCVSGLLLALPFLGYMYTIYKKGSYLSRLGYELLLGGGLSNVYDRIYKGGVIDYIQLPQAYGKVKNIIFNIADVAILVGAGFVGLGFIFQKEDNK